VNSPAKESVAVHGMTLTVFPKSQKLCSTQTQLPETSRPCTDVVA